MKAINLDVREVHTDSGGVGISVGGMTYMGYSAVEFLAFAREAFESGAVRDFTRDMNGGDMHREMRDAVAAAEQHYARCQSIEERTISER